MKIRQNYNHTLNACYLGYITQAIVNNFAPLLFLTFQSTYHISLDKIAMLVSFNFGVQLIVDFLAARFVDRIGYRVSIVAAHIFAAVGLAGLSVFPRLLPNPYIGLLLSVFCYAIGGGLIEVLVSPIVEACPTERKEAAMSLLHSFYCWGQMGVILLSTLFFTAAGIGNWGMLAVIWAVLPAVNACYFLLVPLQVEEEAAEGMSMRELFREKIFWILVLLMICAGASEQGMAQWASAFAESALHVTKALGDLAGPCLFALLMGTARLLHSKLSHRLNLKRTMLGCGLLCILGYLLASLSPWPALSLLGCGICGFSVGVFWPGTFSMASGACPRGGTAMFALLALAGDLGCSAGPGLVGAVSGVFGDNLKTGLLAAILFPVCLILGLRLLKIFGKRKTGTGKGKSAEKDSV